MVLYSCNHQPEKSLLALWQEENPQNLAALSYGLTIIVNIGYG